jgi:hypothetical protein
MDANRKTADNIKAKDECFVSFPGTSVSSSSYKVRNWEPLDVTANLKPLAVGLISPCFVISSK